MNLQDKTVFLSGPMTGKEHYNVSEFGRAHAICKEHGARFVYNPAWMWLIEHDSQGKRYEDYMLKCLHELTRDFMKANYYDCLVLLPGWSNSPGARAEYDVAVACGIPVIDIIDVEDDE